MTETRFKAFTTRGDEKSKNKSRSNRNGWVIVKSSKYRQCDIYKVQISRCVAHVVFYDTEEKRKNIQKGMRAWDA